jgi:biuret amidohydrolase
MPYAFDRIDPSKTAMIVVDMQDDFVAGGVQQLLGKPASV